MSNQIYIIHEKIRHNFKIGSTCNFSNRVGGYITCCDYFDNSTHQIILYDIISNQYTCYQLDWIVQQLSTNYSYPFIKCIGTGGKEFYKLDDFSKLDLFFNLLNIQFTKKFIDIDNLVKTNNTTLIDISKAVSIDSNNFNSHSITLDELNSIVLKLNINKPFQLKQLQIDVRNLFNNFSTRLSHLVISPTGTGKTVIFTLLLCDYIIKNKKNVLIITKKKEILKQLPLRIKNYIESFIKSKLIKNFDYDIVDCVGDCNTSKLSQSSINPQIFIVNWDKLTSSSKTNYKQIKWNNFGFVIIDESHWVGAEQIYNVMSHIKEKTKVNYLGFSATPIRCSQSNQTRILDIFGNKQDYSILYEYSYYQALTNKDICPIKYQVIQIETSDLEDDLDDNEFDDDLDETIIDDKAKTKILSEKAFLKVWNQINSNIVNKTNFKKGIFWFKSRKDLLKFYIWACKNIKDFKLIPTLSVSKTDKQTIKELINKANLSDYDFDNAISNFIDLKSNAILLSVFRFTEGADDDYLEFGVKMFYSSSLSDPLNESQKMGRFSRWLQGNPNGVKKCGYYASLEISDNLEEIKKSLINRFKSWIGFVRTHGTNFTNHNQIKTKEQIQKEIREIIDMYVDIDTIKLFQIDIDKEIIQAYSNRTSDIVKITNALKIENSNRIKNNLDKIDTKSKYDVWALTHDFPSSDDLIESGFNDFTKLFNLDVGKYLSWAELKKISKEYQLKYPDLKPSEIYKIMLGDKNIPDEPEEFYKNKFTCFNDLFL